MSTRNPSRDWLLGSLGNVHLNSQWLAGHMTNYPDPIQQLGVELDVFSKTSRGRALLLRLQNSGIDTDGCNSPMDFAQHLEWNPRSEVSPNEALDQLLKLSAGDRGATLVLLVALRIVLREMTFAIGRMSSDPEVGVELIVELLAAIAISTEHDTIDELLNQTYRATRRTIRRHQWAADREVPWEIDFDYEETEAHSIVLTIEILEKVVEIGAVNESDAELIRLTRVEGVALADIAERRNMAYKAAQRRRHRAESAIRRYLRAGGKS